MDTTPTEFERLVAEGLAASHADQREAALQLFARASEVEPGSGVPHFLIGSEHASAGDFEAAELAFACAVLLAPGFTIARYQLGLLQFSSDRPGAALVTWQPLLEAQDGESLARFVRGFASLAGDHVVEALAHFRAGLACPDVQVAVAADVQKVIDALDRLVAPSGDQGTHDVRHVLLSAYARGLH